MDTRIYPEKQFVIDSSAVMAPELLTTDVTHGEPVHGDDLLAIDMKHRCATREWIKQNSVYMDVDGVMRYVFFIDVVGSKFSDKKYAKYGIKKTESTSVKVARSLGILNDSKWKNVINWVNRNDVNGTVDNTDICTIAKHGQLQDPERSLDIAHWFFQAIYVKLYFDNQNRNLTIRHIAQVIRDNPELSQEIDTEEWYAFGKKIHDFHRGKFFQDACRELVEKNAKGEVFRSSILHQGQILKVAAIESENYRMSAAMRWKDRKGGQFAQVVILKNSKGVIIAYDKKCKVKIAEALAVIRYFEHRAYYNNYDYHWNWKTLRQLGTIKRVPHWFYMVELDMLMNSPAHCAPPSSLSLSKLVNCSLIGLDEKMFHPKHVEFCNKGICREGRNCLNIKCGLPRCVKTRDKQLQRIQKAKKGGKKKSQGNGLK